MVKNKLVITGANGFLGRNTIKLASQDWNIVGIVRRKETFKEITDGGATPSLLPVFSINELIKIFKKANAVINFLGIVAGSESDFQKINVDNFEMVVKAAEESNIRRVICMSGLGVEQYGLKDWATNNYFKSKKDMEKILANSSVPYVIFRPSYILGPRDELIPDLIQSLQKGKADIIGPGSAPMQPIYVKNAVQAILQAASGIGNNNAIYDLVGPEIITMKDLVTRVSSILQNFIKLPAVTVKHLSVTDAENLLGYPKEVSDIFFSDSVGDPKILENALQIHLTSLDETLKQTIMAQLGNVA